MKILLATDGSKFSQAALRSVISQYRPQGAQVRVLHVAVPVDIGLPLDMAVGVTDDFREVETRQLAEAHKLVEKTAEKLRRSGFKTNTTVVEGNAKVLILDVAEQWRADLIIVGSHGRKGLDRFLIGSVSEFVARHAPCSVQIVRIPAKR